MSSKKTIKSVEPNIADLANFLSFKTKFIYIVD